MLTIVLLADEDFLTAAPAFVNKSVMGTLSATLVAHPSLDDEQVEAAVSALKYGMVPTALHTEACCISTAATTARAHCICYKRSQICSISTYAALACTLTASSII